MLDFLILLLPWLFLLGAIALAALAVQWLARVQRGIEQIQADLRRLCELVDKNGRAGL
jgi:hypothetical protein